MQDDIRQGCQGIYSAYSVFTFCIIMYNIIINLFNSGLKLYYGSYGYSDGFNITSDLSTIFV